MFVIKENEFQQSPKITYWVISIPVSILVIDEIFFFKDFLNCFLFLTLSLFCFCRRRSGGQKKQRHGNASLNQRWGQKGGTRPVRLALLRTLRWRKRASHSPAEAPGLWTSGGWWRYDEQHTHCVLTSTVYTQCMYV